jgi:molybdate/tungstate transport system substrate-binding protein
LHHVSRGITAGIIGVSILATVAGCGGSGNGNKGTVEVLYAGSLVNLMEHTVGPAFTSATGFGYQGEGAGSTQLANEIKSGIRTPDVFISADPNVDQTLIGPSNGNYVSWYLTFISTQMVIAYTPNGPFAQEFQEVQQGKLNWYDVLRQSSVRIGRTDPKLDPKGYRTIIMLELAEQYYSQPGLTQQILGPAENPAQIFPEENLVARLETGQLDAGFFYLNEAKDQNLSVITLPPQINLSDPSLASAYATATYTSSSGQVIHGAPIVYTITIPRGGRNVNGAIAFVRFLLGAQGKALLQADGLTPIAPTVGGDPSTLPSQLRDLVGS